jgi:poly(3-hydroxybutyrate) depolymerase
MDSPMTNQAAAASSVGTSRPRPAAGSKSEPNLPLQIIQGHGREDGASEGEFGTAVSVGDSQGRTYRSGFLAQSVVPSLYG